jgi:hypothetical protein
MTLPYQLLWLFILAIPVACIAWTVTHEEVFLEIRNYCIENSKHRKYLWQRKFFYLFTCEYCFSHYVTIFMLIISDYTLLMNGWRGYLIAGFSIVWVANIYMSLFALLRMDIKAEKTNIALTEEEIKKEVQDTAEKK